MIASLKRLYQDEEVFRAAILVVFALACVVALLAKFAVVIWPFLTAIILASFFNSWISKLQSIGIPRSVGAGLLVILFVTIVLLGVITLSFFIQKHFLYYSCHIHTTIAFLADWIPQKINDLSTSLHLPFELNAEKIREYLVNGLGNLSEMMFHYASTLYKGAKSVVGFFSFLFFVPILTFYLLKDWPKFVEKTRVCLPERILSFADFALPRARQALKNQIHGQIKVCCVVFLFYSTCLFFIGLKPYIFLGFLSGLLTFIPFIGVFIAFVVSFAVAISQGLGLFCIFSVAVLYFVGSSIESNFLTPRWVGEKIGMHPVWIFFAVLTVLAWLGMAGAFFVMPLAALVWSLIQSTIQWFREYELNPAG